MTLKFALITLFPEIFDALKYGVLGRAIEQQLIQIDLINPRDFLLNDKARVDDRPYGGGPGMVMKYQPLRDAITHAKMKLDNARVIYLSPQGQPLTQQRVIHLTQSQPSQILICGRYEGIDQRVIDTLVDEQISVGDYVLSGGEFACLNLIDAQMRLLPGALGHEDSALQDSFSDGLLDCPHYTRPESIDGLAVPSVLQSGDHAKIAVWRAQQSVINTWQMRQDLIQRHPLSPKEQALIASTPRESENE